MSDTQSMIQLQDLTHIYRTDSVETTALKAISLNVEPGEFVAVRGPSGCGKSTLLNIAGMLDQPTSGTYHFLGNDVTALDETRLAEIRRRHLGFIFQSFHLLEELSVRENVEFALLFHKLAASERRKRAADAMERMAIAHRASHMPTQLSGGQQQRVAIARALVSKPDLILADEPTGNLDSRNGTDVMNLLTELNRQGTTILMVTHSQAHAEFARRDINLFDGEMIAEQMRKSI